MDISTGYHEYPLISADNRRTIDYASNEDIILCDHSCEALRIWHFNPRSKSFSALPEAPHLKHLEIFHSNCIDLVGLEKYPLLQRLDLYYCTKLESLNGIESLSKDIYCFWLEHSKKLTDHSSVTALPKLRTLGMHSCGTMQSIDFVNALEKLTTFTFIDTDVADGDMTPLLMHSPKLKFISFSNKRHFSHKNEDILKQLDINT